MEGVNQGVPHVTEAQRQMLTSEEMLQDDSMLLLTLGEVSTLVAHSHDLSETLTNIVHHIQQRFHTDVCSVYTLDSTVNELVLSATVGLHCESVNQIRMPIEEGLVGLVVERMEPVSVEDAPTHPRYRYFPETGEEQYHSFLGVPLVQGGSVQGVLVVQHREKRRYSNNEIRLLTGVAAQLAILVTNSRLTRHLSEFIQKQQVLQETIAQEHSKPNQIHGVPASPGLAHGVARRFEEFDFTNPRLVSRPPGSVQDEQQLFEHALEQARLETDVAARHLVDLLGEQFGAIVQAQRLMLEDSNIQRELRRLIQEGASVEQAVVAVCSDYLKAFQKLDNPFFYERIYDIKDVFRRLLGIAVSGASQKFTTGKLVVVAHEVSLLELFACDLSRVSAIVVEKGGAYSHVAILARSLGIPMLTQARDVMACVRDGDEMFVDAGSGTVYVNPEQTRRDIFMEMLRRPAPETNSPASQPPPIRLEATVNLLPEVARTVQLGGEAVGLYRSEFLELARRSFPTEEEQLVVYRKMLQILDGRPLTLRTLDLRREKLFGIEYDAKLHQPIDWRLVADSAMVRDLIRTQLRAAFRAAASGALRVLFPLVTSQRQLTCALSLAEEAKQSLEEDGLPYNPNVPLGIMIEVPSAAMNTRRWAPLVDFVCIGSNDLLHALLGIERTDDEVLHLRTPLDPSYLATVRYIIKHAHACHKSVTVCGEAASNPQAALALYAMGANALSVPPDDLEKVRRVFQDVQLPSDLNHVRHDLLRATSAEQVQSLLDQYFPTQCTCTPTPT